MTHLPGYLLVFLGGGLGSMLRHAVNQASAFLLGAGFWGTLFVNIIGSLAMGVLAGWSAFRGGGSGPGLRLFLTTGLLERRSSIPGAAKICLFFGLKQRQIGALRGFRGIAGRFQGC